MPKRETALGVKVLALLLLLLGMGAAAGAGNNATVDEGSSGVAASGAPGVVLAVRVRVGNTGDTTWRAASGHRLGATASNQVGWSSFPCGGYVNNPQDSRMFLCGDVAPGQAYDFQFSVTLPSSGGAALSVRMVQDGVEWFGETQGYSIAVTSGCANSALVTPSDRWKLEIFNNKALSVSTVEQRYEAVGAGGFSFSFTSSSKRTAPRVSGACGVPSVAASTLRHPPTRRPSTQPGRTHTGSSSRHR